MVRETPMPEEYDRQRILDFGQNPGLGVRKLHERGLTGRGIGLAIIDQPLLVEHQEYRDRLKLNEEINVRPDANASMHGPAVTELECAEALGVEITMPCDPDPWFRFAHSHHTRHR